MSNTGLQLTLQKCNRDNSPLSNEQGSTHGGGKKKVSSSMGDQRMLPAAGGIYFPSTERSYIREPEDPPVTIQSY